MKYVTVILSVLQVAKCLSIAFDSCFDLEGNTTYTGTACSPANNVDILVTASTPAPFHASLEAADTISQTLCYYTGSPAPTSLADMPTVLPDASDCSDGNSGVGWTKIIVKNPGMANVGIYFRDNNVPANGWKMWIIQSNNQLDYELETLPAPPAPPPTPIPTDTPTAVPTSVPTTAPTSVPGALVTASPTSSPTASPQATNSPPPADVCTSYSDNQLSVDVKIISSIATITFEGPSTAWIGVGFGTTMSGTYSITYHDSKLEELILSTNGVANVPVTQTALTFTEEVTNGRRKLVCTRPFDDTPYTFPTTGGVDIIIACGKCSSSGKTMLFGNHGTRDRKHSIVAFSNCPAVTNTPTTAPTPTPPSGGGGTPAPPTGGGGSTAAPIGAAPNSNSSGGLSLIVIIIIILGVVLLFCAIGLFAYLRTKKGKKGKNDKKKKNNKNKKKNNNNKDKDNLLDNELGEPLLQGEDQEMHENNERKVGIDGTEHVEEYEDVRADDLSTVDSSSSSSKQATTVTSKSEVIRGSEHALSDLESSAHESFSQQYDVYPDDNISTPSASPSIDYREDPELQQLRQDLRDKNHELSKMQTSNVRFDRQLMSLDDQLLAACAAKQLPTPQRKGSLLPPTIDVEDL